MAQSPVGELRGSVKDVMGNVNAVFGSGAKKGPEFEKQKYLLAQLSAFNMRLDELEKAVSVGFPLTEATDAMEKLGNIDHSMQVLESKLNLYISNVKELRDAVDELNKSVANKPTKKQIDMLSEKATYLEKLYSEMSVSKTKDTFVALVEILESLEKRIKTMEDVIGKELGDYIGIVQKEKRSASGTDYFAQPGAEYQKPAKKQQASAGAGFFSKIKDFFGL